MIPTAFAILLAVPIWFFGYAVGRLVEHHESQEEIDELTKRIHTQSIEENYDSQT